MEILFHEEQLNIRESSSFLDERSSLFFASCLSFTHFAKAVTLILKTPFSWFLGPDQARWKKILLLNILLHQQFFSP